VSPIRPRFGRRSRATPSRTAARPEAPPSQRAPDRTLDAGQSTIHGSVPGRVSLLKHNARQFVEDHLDPADLVDTTARPIHVQRSNADSDD